MHKLGHGLVSGAGKHGKILHTQKRYPGSPGHIYERPDRIRAMDQSWGTTCSWFAGETNHTTSGDSIGRIHPSSKSIEPQDDSI